MSPHSISPPKFVVQQGPAETDLQPRALQVKGNAPLYVKRQCLLLLQIFVITPDMSYGGEVGRRLKLVELNVWDSEGPSRRIDNDTTRGKGGSKVAESVFEITVEKEMVNSVGVLHGGCAAYIIDPCSASPLIVLGIVEGKVSEYAGLSQAMNIMWHQPIRLGAKIRIVSTSMAVNGKIKTARCEIWNGDLLCISATHSMAPPGKGPVLKDGNVVKL